MLTAIRAKKTQLCWWKSIKDDRDYSGLNFDRPDFNQVTDDIEAGKLDVVITRDLSRLGRDHLQVGHFTRKFTFR